MRTVSTTIRFPLGLYKKLKAEAKEKGMSLNGYVLSKLWSQSSGSIKKGEK